MDLGVGRNEQHEAVIRHVRVYTAISRTVTGPPAGKPFRSLAHLLALRLGTTSFEGADSVIASFRHYIVKYLTRLMQLEVSPRICRPARVPIGPANGRTLRSVLHMVDDVESHVAWNIPCRQLWRSISAESVCIDAQ